MENNYLSMYCIGGMLFDDILLSEVNASTWVNRFSLLTCPFECEGSEMKTGGQKQTNINLIAVILREKL